MNSNSKGIQYKINYDIERQPKIKSETIRNPGRENSQNAHISLKQQKTEMKLTMILKSETVGALLYFQKHQ